LNYRKLTFSK